jgi:hypothetical protein
MKNHVWVIECWCEADGKYLPAYNGFYHTKREALAGKPKNCKSKWIGDIKYRVRKYEAVEK